MKLYVITRKDLSIQQQAVQSGHAVAEFLLYGPESKWDNGTLVYLGVKNLRQLIKVILELKRKNVDFVEFKEPDMNDEITSIATDTKIDLFDKLNLL